MSVIETSMEAHLGLKDITQCKGGGGRGCISAGQKFETEKGPIFVKTNEKLGAETMFKGEYASLRAIASTNAIKCPMPLGVFPVEFGWGLAMEYIEMGGDRDEKALARDLANLHLANAKRFGDEAKISAYVAATDVPEECLPTRRYGFPVDTCCGFLRQPNDWTEKWDEFFIRHRLQFQINLLEEKGDRDVIELWPQLQLKAADLLREQNEFPSLVHGDLWSGNWGFSKDGPVIFDPASFYADPEYEEGIMKMFGGLSHTFWTEYHKQVPKRPGREDRVLLYELFHHLNHWNHFGGGYKSSSINLIHKILAL